MTSDSTRLESNEKRLLANRFVVVTFLGIVILATPESVEAETLILLVEDDVALGALAEEFLVRAGYRVRRATSPDEAIEIALHTTARLDLLLTDVIMPGMTGDRLREVVAAMRPDIAGLYMSGYPDDALAERGVLLPGIQ